MIFADVTVFENEPFIDHRGELYTVFNQKNSQIIFNHDKIAISKYNVLRGLHGDPYSWKLITCLYGEIYLVIVDCRPESSTYMKWDKIILSQDNKKSILVPPNFANGHYVMSDMAIFFYKWSYDGEYPDVNNQFSLYWNDPDLSIEWPCVNPILSDRDNPNL